ncbi:tpr repeat-containing protein zip4, partial [Quercus suber]
NRLLQLSYHLWNSCVDLSNLNPKLRSSSSSSFSLDLAKLRHITANILSLAGNVSGVPSLSIKFASFYYKTGLIWHDLRHFDLAFSFFEKATNLLFNSNTAASSPPTMQQNFSSMSISPDLVLLGNSRIETSSSLCLVGLSPCFSAPITTVRSLTST